MTAIISWVTNDGKPGAASLYIASDSRITSEREDGGYEILDDKFQKVFASHHTPDIFAICGPISGARELVAELINAAVRVRREKSYGEGAENVFPEDLFRDGLSQRAFGVQPGLSIFHGYRFGSRRFGLTKVTFAAEQATAFRSYTFGVDWGLLAVDGQGDAMVVKKQGEYIDSEAESKGYSRWLWMSFYASLVRASEITCGGAPQLVGLYGEGGGKVLGVYFNGEPFVAGRPCVRTDIEYRDELFQRVDASGVRFPDAQPHARMGKPRIFQFAP